jgi:predicted NACHT family NTPase
MIQFLKKASVSLMALVLVVMTASAGGNAAKSAKKSGVNWNPVMDAIIQVESEGNPKAVSGNSVGAMQITPILVKDCNEILKKQKSKKRFTMADRFSVAKSKEMFLLIQSHYNPENSIEKAIRSWNGGVKYSIRATNRYYKKVMAKMK